MKVKIKPDGVSKKRIEDFVRQQPRAFSKAVKTGLLRVGLEIRNRAGTKAPYLTGTLRRSLTQNTNQDAIYKHSSTGKSQKVDVGSNLAYARIQEYGGRTGRGGKGGKGQRGATRIVGRKFLTPAFEQMKKGEGAKIVNEEVGHAIKKSIK